MLAPAAQGQGSGAETVPRRPRPAHRDLPPREPRALAGLASVRLPELQVRSARAP